MKSIKRIFAILSVVVLLVVLLSTSVFSNGIIVNAATYDSNIVVDGSSISASSKIVNSSQSDYGLSVDESVGANTRAKLIERLSNKRSGSISVTLHSWFSNDEFGDVPDRYVAGDRVYLCYELIESDTGERINSIIDKSYSATLILYNPDGSVLHSNQVNNDDNSWISVIPRQAGTYSGTVTISGDINLTVDVAFDLVYDASLYSSLSSFSLNLNETNTRTSTITVAGGYPGEYGARYSIGDSTIASASWGDWNGNSISITVSGKKIGTTNIVISLYENYSSNQNVIKSITIPITVVSNSYTVSFNANGGSVSTSSKIVTYGYTYGSLPTPTRTGYTFDGWYTSSSGGSKVTSSTTVSTASNHTLYAHWTANIETLRVNSTNSAVISIGGEIKKFTFTPTTTGKYVIYSIGSADTYVYLYDANGSELSYDDDGGEGANFRLEYNLTAGTKYTFGIKYYNSSNAGTISFKFGNVFTITYNANGGSNAPSSQSKDYGKSITLSTTEPTYNGKTFLGWATSSTATSASYQPGGSFNTEANTTLYAVWRANTYTVTFDANGGSVSPSSKTVTYNSTYGSLPTPTRTGYTFDGWYTSSSGGSKVTSSTTVSTASNHTLYARWTEDIEILSVNSTNSAVISTGGEIKKFTFTPTTTGKYVIYSIGFSDTKVYLYDANGSELTSDDDDGDERNFRLEYNLTAGTKYTFGVEYYSSSNTGTISFKFGNVFTITYNANGGSNAPSSQSKDVSLAENPGIISLRSNISYDSSALELVSVQDCNLLEGYTTPATNMSSPYTLRWADSLVTANNTKTGQLVKLTFQIKDDANPGNYDISVSHVEARNAAGTKVIFSDKTAKVTVKEAPINVNGVALNKETLLLKSGRSETLVATVSPNNANNKAVTWKSSDTTIATVDNNGRVTAIKKGSATITVTTQDGSFTDTCNVSVACSHVNQTVVPATDSDCKIQGWDAYNKCDDCGQYLDDDGTIEIDKIPIRPLTNQHIGGKATCNVQAVCTVCGKSYGALAAHSFNKADKKAEALKSEGNCRDNAVFYYSCSVCDKVENNDSHTFFGDKNVEKHVGGTEVVNKKDAVHKTQTKGYSGDTKCLGCNTILSKGKDVAPTAHIPGAAPTETIPQTCTICGYIIKPVLGHTCTPVAIPGKAATCTEKGLAEGRKCSGCGAILKARTEIPAIGHKEEVINGKAATCTEKGLSDSKKCSVCGEITVPQNEIPAKGHNASDWEIKTPATTQAEGLKVKKCTACGIELESEIIQRLTPAYVLGDINGDGKVTATDARLILRIATKLEKLEEQKVTVFAAADVNGDNKITATDARKVLRVSTKLESF